MYKYLICSRYLWTRYLALASIISVMLGVGTLVVVNSVMAGFSSKLLTRFRGLQSDVVVRYRSYYGFGDLENRMRYLRERLGPRLVEIAPVIEAFAMAEYQFDRSSMTIKKPVKIIGIDPVTRAATSDFANWLQSQDNRLEPSKCFELRGQAKQMFDHYHQNRWQQPALPPGMLPPAASNASENQGVVQVQGTDKLPAAPPMSNPPSLPPAKPYTIIAGWGLATIRNIQAHQSNSENTPEQQDRIILHPGDTVRLMMGTRDDIVGIDGSPRSQVAHTADFIVSDLFRSDMSVIDSMVMFISLEDLQQMQTMHNMATTLELKLANYDRDIDGVMKELYVMFPESFFEVKTWKEIGGPVIGAIAVERSILNVLLFLIIAVAGFGILAIFYMIVVEKTRDIGILKSLGASNWGVMGIFISYGLLLGLVGSGLGTLGGIAFTHNINEIERLLSRMLGQDVFPKDIYFFDKIPVELNFWTIVWVNLGAMAIATGASVLPAIRAAMLHPVRALRFD
jgi:lipoprotein-releasing system permease protein